MQDSIAVALTERIVAKARALPVGDPTKAETLIGPLINAGQRDRTHDIVQRAIAGGAYLATGGSYEALFYQPTVLTGVTPGNPASRKRSLVPSLRSQHFITMTKRWHLRITPSMGFQRR